MVRPPSNAWRAPVWPPPSWSTTCCLIHDVKYGYLVSSRGGWISRRSGIGSAIAASYCSRAISFCSSMRASTSSRRFLAATGWAIGSKALGEATTPAISAASCGSSWAAQGRARSVSQPGCWLPK